MAAMTVDSWVVRLDTMLADDLVEWRAEPWAVLLDDSWAGLMVEMSVVVLALLMAVRLVDQRAAH